jgi:glycosyltransferase involved in cell wall biosynthesis
LPAVTVTLSALVCVRDEERNLAACLRRLGFADEIVVVLDRCSERSAEIARRHADRVVIGTFPLEGSRQAAGAEACAGDWILEIDADERVGDALAEEIRQTVSSAVTASHFLVPVDNYVGARPVRHAWDGFFGASAATRLYRRGCKHWHSRHVHPRATLDGAAGGRLCHPLARHVDDDVSEMIRRLDRYSEARALDLIDANRVGSLGSAALLGLRRFWNCYVRRRGYREGRWGLRIAVMAGSFAFLPVLRAHLLLARRGGQGPTPETDLRRVAAE